MSIQLFNPFSELSFDENTCFLTGEDIAPTEKIQVFPEWILNHYNYWGKTFTMMDNITYIKYEDLKVPCSNKVKAAFDKIDQEVRIALENGYEAIKDFDEHRLFLWMGKIVYGILYIDLDLERKRLKKYNKTFKLSHFLQRRFGLFHLFLQSLIHPFEFIGQVPWSLSFFRVKYSQDVFNFKDNTANLFFSLGMKDFGITASLQDSEFVKKENEKLLQLIGNKVLHPIQFEELCAKFLYYTYLLQVKPKYKIEIGDDKVKVINQTTVPDNGQIFGKWDGKEYSKVLAGYWEIWGLKQKDIFSFPDNTISYLEDPTTFELINPDSIDLVY